MPLILGVKVLHIICNNGTSGLPDMYAVCLKPKGHTSPWLYISGRPCSRAHVTNTKFTFHRIIVN